MTEQQVTRRRMRDRPADPERMRSALDALVRAKGLERWAYFGTTVEGIALGDDLEEYSGSVVDERGRVFDFWMGADPNTGQPALTTWREVDPTPEWPRGTGYRRARERLGLADV